ncbi:MAG: OmpA family protein [Pseudomonadota bacterium]
MLFCSVVLAGCASGLDTSQFASSIQAPNTISSRWMHTREAPVVNQFRLCDTDCPVRTQKTIALVSAKSEVSQIDPLSTPQTSSQVIDPIKNIHIYFPPTSFALDETARKTLSQTVTFLNRDHTRRRVLIRGRTDDLGSSALNNELALHRGLAIRNFLRDKELRRDINITVMGKGKCCYVTDNVTEKGRSRNRRAEILFFEEGNT